MCKLQETQYSAVVKLPSHQFQHIVRDMSQFGDTIIISGTKEGVEFATASSASSDGSAKVTLRQSSCIEKEDDQVTVCVCVLLVECPPHTHSGGYRAN